MTIGLKKSFYIDILMQKIDPKRHVIGAGSRFCNILSESNLLGRFFRVTIIISGKFYVDPENMTP